MAIICIEGPTHEIDSFRWLSYTLFIPRYVYRVMYRNRFFTTRLIIMYTMFQLKSFVKETSHFEIKVAFVLNLVHLLGEITSKFRIAVSQ